MPKRMRWEVIDVFCEKRKPHWMIISNTSIVSFKITCFALFGRASLQFISEYQVESKAVSEKTLGNQRGLPC